MIVDFGDCRVRGLACQDCVVSVLLGVPELPARGSGEPGGSRYGARRLRLEQDEHDAMEVLADSGLIPRLRLVSSEIPSGREAHDGGRGDAPDHAAG